MSSAAWALTTVQWLETQRKHRGHLIDAHPGQPAPVRLLIALKNMKFRYVERVMLAKVSEDAWMDELTLLTAESWDDELHRQMKEFLDEGGYDAERAVFSPSATKAKRTPKAKVSPDGTLTVPESDVVLTGGRMPGKATAVAAARASQDLDEVVEQEILSRDARLGAW